MSRQLLCTLAILLARCVPFQDSVLSAQALSSPDETRWNSTEVRELVARARVARQTLAASADLQTYQARTEGHVYFFVDPEQGERYLIRIDQIATEVQWEAPDRLRQHIVGERSETRLPVRDFDYYMDRLTLVPHGFGNEIRIGSGMDVASVRHPLAPTAGAPDDDGRSEFYDFRLGESLALFVAERDEPIRIQEVAVRPRDPGRPGILGTIHLDRASASIVRMAFTFTPASYIDPRNDRISVELDYGLWESRYWLPNVQRIEVRREVPFLDLGIGTVIRAVLRVRDYLLDAPIPEVPAAVPRVTFVSQEEREAYRFSTGLYEDMPADGLGDLVVDADPRELRARAMELIETVPPSGLSPLRLHLPGLSSALRYGRAEGVRLGVGGSGQPRPGVRIRATTGYAVADAKFQARLGFEALLTPEWTLGAEFRARDLEDLGLSPGSSSLVSTLGAVFKGEDYLDPFFVNGAGIRLDYRTDEASTVSFGLGVERHSSGDLELDSAPLGQSRLFRPVRPVTDTEFFRAGVGLRRPIRPLRGGRGWGEVDALFLYGQDGKGVGITAELDERWQLGSPGREMGLGAIGWAWFGDPLAQGHRLLGGRGTIPGFPYREFVGKKAVVATLSGSIDVWGPLVRLRGGLHSGWSDGGNPLVAESWNAGATNGIRTSVSIGVGLGWDLVHLDLARGFHNGEWQLLLSIDRRWWERL